MKEYGDLIAKYAADPAARNNRALCLTYLRDLPTAVPLPEIEKALRIKNEPTFEAVASRGTGVFETLKAVVKAVLLDLNTR